MSVLPTFAGMMDYSSLKHSIIPRLVTTCESESTSLGVSDLTSEHPLLSHPPLPPSSSSPSLLLLLPLPSPAPPSHQLLVKCLVTIGKMLDHFDKLILVDQVIPMLEKIKSREPAVLMAMLGMEVWSCI